MIKSKNIKEIGDGILEFLKKNKLESSLSEVIDYLKESSAHDSVIVTSAKELGKSEKSDVISLITELTGSIPGQILYKHDESLIDGLVVSYKDKLWDLSLKSQLNKISAAS